jgi:hypothetical protein
MPRIADYAIIADANRTWGDIEEIHFTLPDSCDLGSRSILAWMLTIKTVADQVNLNVLVNGVQTYNAHFGGNRYGPLFEVVNANVLKHGDNVVNFLFTMDDATSVVISDIVLWWQANI